jgi:hypothetical protein
VLQLHAESLLGALSRWGQAVPQDVSRSHSFGARLMSGRGETRELLGTVSDLLSQHGITIRPETLEQVEEALENRGSGSRTAQRRRTSPIATTRRSSASPSRSHTSYAPDPPNPLTHPPPLVQDEPLFAGPSETTPQSFRYNYNLTPQTAAPPIAGLSASRAGGAESPNEESFGTLVLSQSGRSTYLGPTAGPEWLRNVSTTARHVSSGKA